MKRPKLPKEDSTQLETESEGTGVEIFGDVLAGLSPQERRIMLKNLAEECKEEGNDTPFAAEFMVNPLFVGLYKTPYGLFYAMGTENHVMNTYLFQDDDLAEYQIMDTEFDSDEFLSDITDEFSQEFPYLSYEVNHDYAHILFDQIINNGYSFAAAYIDESCENDLQRDVLMAVQKVPYGTTISYEELANLVGKPHAVRAVAAALAENPYPFCIPCHRVIHKDGSVGDYIYGSKVKQAIIDYEKAHS